MRTVTVRQAWKDSAWSGAEHHGTEGKAGMEREGKTWIGLNRQGDAGEASSDGERFSKEGYGRRGWERYGLAGLDEV